MGALEAASRAFREYGEISAALGHQVDIAISEHNTGWLASARGDLPEALERYASAAARLQAIGMTSVDLVVDQVSAYLSGGLATDALATVEASRGRCSRASAPTC
jgi:hypothetical protein